LRCDGLGDFDVAVALEAVRCQLEHPGKHQCGEEADRQQSDQRLHHPIGRAEHRQQRRGDLRDQPRADQIQPGHADDVAALEFFEQVHGRTSSAAM